VIKKLRGEYDVMKDRERAREEECKELQAKCEAAMTEFKKNPTVEVEEVKQDKRDVVSKVVPYVVMELVYCDNMDPLAPIEDLLSKKPPSLQRPAPLRTQVPLPSSQKATPSLVPVSNPMYPPADVSIVKPLSSQL
nr:hypothetical protein [Tanacetum cinerariifolium]